MSSKNVVIVSAYSTGAEYANAFSRLGFNCFHLTTRNEWEIERLRSSFRNDFKENFIIDDGEAGVNKTIKKISSINPRVILAGCESGVLLADKISQYFEVPKNDFTLSYARRNKFNMVEAIRSQGLLVPQQFKSSNVDEIVQWFVDQRFPKIILKPLLSAASDSVSICCNKPEILTAFDQIISAKDLYGNVNSEVLAQAYLEGDEFIVNTLSYDGAHKILDMWQGVSYTPDKVSSDDYAEALDSSFIHFEVLTSYAKKCLSALGIFFGPAHCEIKLTQNGPCIIEIGARLPGKIDSHSLQKLYGATQVEDTVFSFANASLPKHTYSLRQQGRYIYMASQQEGIIKKAPTRNFFDGIASLDSLHLSVKKGGRLEVTDKPHRKPRPGFAYLVSQKKEEIESDYELFKEREKAFYEYLISD